MYNTYKTKQLWKFTNHLQILWLELSLYISINHNLGVQYVKFFIRKDLFLHSLLIESKKKKKETIQSMLIILSLGLILQNGILLSSNDV